MSKKLEDIIGKSNINSSDSIPEDYIKSTEPETIVVGKQCASINFNKLGIDYFATDLIGYGFDSTCATCDNHYTVVFVIGEIGNSSITVSGSNLIFLLPVDNTIKNGNELCDYFISELLKEENKKFINHYQQYTYKNGTIYLYDNRTKYNINNFWTSVHKVAMSISAIYIGPDIEVGKDYNKDDVIVTVLYTDTTSEQLQRSEFTLSDVTVSKYGPNAFIVYYKNNNSMTSEIIVNSLPREIFKITCEYTGPDIYVWNKYNINNIEVYIYYSDDPLNAYKIPITDCNIENNMVEQDGENKFSLTYDSSQLNYTIPNMVYTLYYTVNGIGISHLYAEYIGDSIYTNNPHKTSDVKVKIIYLDGTSLNIENNECIFEDNLITNQTPFDTFTVSWIDKGNNEWIAKYKVPTIGVTNIIGEYTGPNIIIGDNYDIKHLSITGFMSDNTKFIVDVNDCVINDTLINYVGVNNKTIYYTDINLINWEINIAIIGLPKPLSINANFIGMIKFVGSTVPKEEIKVSLTQSTDINNTITENIILNSDEWYFQTINVVSYLNNGILTITYEKDYIYKVVKLSTNVTIPFYDLTKAYLVAWYEGPPIEIGNSFDITNVVIYLCEDGKDNIRLLYTTPGVIIETGIISKKGDNWFYVKYIYERYTLTTKFPVEGVVYKQYPDKDFEIFHITTEYKKTDLTEKFRPYFEFQGYFFVSWEQFIKRVYDFKKEGTPFLGTFILTVPKNTGLLNKYASTWKVFCKDEKTLKAHIIKIYNDEIKENNANG